MKKNLKALASLFFIGSLSLFVLVVFGYCNLQIIGHIVSNGNPFIPRPSVGCVVTLLLDIIMLIGLFIVGLNESINHFGEHMETARSWFAQKKQTKAKKNSDHPTTF